MIINNYGSIYGCLTSQTSLSIGLYHLLKPFQMSGLGNVIS